MGGDPDPEVRVTVALCAIVRNEGAYLAEWLAWHRRMGVTRVYLYDNESEDDTATVAEAAGAEVIDWPGGRSQDGTHSAQMVAYAHCLRRLAHTREADWLVVVDADEFVWDPARRSLPEVLAGVTEAGSVWMPWRVFGWGGHLRRPAGSTLANYLYRAPDDFGGGVGWAGKSIVRVGVDVVVGSPHWFDTTGGTEYDTGLLVNHYYTRSREEAYERRIRRRREDFGAGTWDEVEQVAALCTVYDDRLARLAEP